MARLGIGGQTEARKVSDIGTHTTAMIFGERSDFAIEAMTEPQLVPSLAV